MVCASTLAVPLERETCLSQPANDQCASLRLPSGVQPYVKLPGHLKDVNKFLNVCEKKTLPSLEIITEVSSCI